MKAKVLAPVTIYGLPRQIGGVVEVDATTFANLERKGRLSADVEAPTESQEKPEPTAQPKERKPRK